MNELVSPLAIQTRTFQALLVAVRFHQNIHTKVLLGCNAKFGYQNRGYCEQLSAGWRTGLDIALDRDFLVRQRLISLAADLVSIVLVYRLFCRLFSLEMWAWCRNDGLISTTICAGVARYVSG